MNRGQYKRLSNRSAGPMVLPGNTTSVMARRPARWPASAIGR